MADEQGFCDGMVETYDEEINFDKDVKKVIDEGIKEARQMDPEKRAQVIETAGRLAYDIMIVESIGDERDAKVARGRKEAAENFIKEELKRMVSQEDAFKQERYPYAELLVEAKKAAEKEKERIFNKGKTQAAEKIPEQKTWKRLKSTSEELEIETGGKIPEQNLNAKIEAR
ncbi:uncharacterized protein LOC111347655, partial [Stylophora pistillata]